MDQSFFQIIFSDRCCRRPLHKIFEIIHVVAHLGCLIEQVFRCGSGFFAISRVALGRVVDLGYRLRMY